MFFRDIKTHDIVRPSTASMGTRQISVYFTGTKKMPFSRIHSSIMARRKLTIFAVETPSE